MTDHKLKKVQNNARTQPKGEKIKTWRKSKLVRFVFMPLTAFALLSILATIHVFPATITRFESLKFTTRTMKDSSMELGESKVKHSGADGEKKITYAVSRSLLDIIFGNFSGQKKVVSSKTTKKPVQEIIISGTKRYQYMYCSSGRYRFFTDKQFKDPNTGFTKKSPDYCKQNKEGTKTQLADSAPGSSNIVNVRPNVPSNCTSTTIPYTTLYKNVSYLESGQTQSTVGHDGYKFTCSDSYESANSIIEPVDKIVYRGTGRVSTPSTALSQKPQARQKCISDYNSARAQIGATGGGGSAYDQLNSLYRQCLGRAGY